MNFLQRLSFKFRQFMYGRYGTDQLTIAMLILSIVLFIASRISGVGFINYIGLGVLAICYFRMFSKNTSARYKENQKFMKLWGPMGRGLSGFLARRKDHTHAYYKCPNCKLRVRVPRGKGKIKIKCPECKTEFIKKT
ncbi:MAG: hypothetical protein E7328_02605 [Clostridiales bacterium]|nr:hypothetical protein [Clostridiales bacterium]